MSSSSGVPANSRSAASLPFSSSGWRSGHNPPAWFDDDAIIDYNEITQLARREAMASITIRNLAPAVKERLRVRAAEHGHSMEAEAREILQSALDRPKRSETLTGIMRELFGTDNGVELELPAREPGPPPPAFE
jgi:antitoxin FitA